MLTNGDLDYLRNFRKQKGRSPREACRAQVLILSHKGYSTAEISDIEEVTPRTVSNIRKNYREKGVEKALKDDPRPEHLPKFDEKFKAK